MPNLAELFRELPGVDAHRAGRGAQTVRRTGSKRHVGKVASSAAWNCGFSPGACRRSISRRTTMRWRGVRVSSPAGALGLAVAALDALVDLVFDPGHGLQVGEVGLGIGIDDHARIQQAVGIDQLLQALHDRYASPPHSASTNGAMLRPVPCSALSAPS